MVNRISMNVRNSLENGLVVHSDRRAEKVNFRNLLFNLAKVIWPTRSSTYWNGVSYSVHWRRAADREICITTLSLLLCCKIVPSLITGWNWQFPMHAGSEYLEARILRFLNSAPLLHSLHIRFCSMVDIEPFMVGNCCNDKVKAKLQAILNEMVKEIRNARTVEERLQFV